MFCLLETGGGGRRPNQNCLQKPKNELLFYDTSESKKITGKLRSKLPNSTRSNIMNYKGGIFLLCDYKLISNSVYNRR